MTKIHQVIIRSFKLDPLWPAHSSYKNNLNSRVKRPDLLALRALVKPKY
ncbi:MAG: hypothetical protein ACI8XV_000448 [Arenicella sp.]|jgi:hypothetical protein